MLRTVGLVMLLLAIAPAHGSPVRGQYREPQLNGNERSILNPGTAYEFQETFRSNQRACVIVVGDHDPPMNLTLKVFDAAGNLVAGDNAGGDINSVIWYPPTTQRYLISITGDGQVFNRLDVLVK